LDIFRIKTPFPGKNIEEFVLGEVEEMKLVKKAIAVVLATVLFVLANIHPGNVYAGNLETPDTEPESGMVYYEVRKGDSLWDLAERFGVRISDLTDANSLKEDGILEEGRRLMIPVSAIRHYTVKPGDTLWGIAREFRVDVEALETVNRISAEDALAVDRELIVPEPDRSLIEDEDTDPEVGDYDLGLSDLTVWPVTGQVSSEFGQRWGRRHEGLDVAADEGKPIRALESGTVVFAGRRGTYGKTIIINHGHGFRSLYAHASSLEVSPGEYVEQGQTIARVGSTGHSTGPHLHLEILYRGTPLNPERYLPTGEGQI
jgi:murein DD-endopeptidase MepM/ murein hydrolase activator NlpD